MKAFVFLLIAIFSSSAQAQDELPEAIPLKIQEAFIPMGFDSNDRVQITVEGKLPTTCYRVGPYKAEYDISKAKLTLTQYAYKYKGPCMAMATPFQNTMNIGISSGGVYQVKDGTDDGTIGRLQVGIAKTARADDYLYAPVTDATVNPRRRQLTVSGNFHNSCMTLSELRVMRESHNVVTALPISEIENQGECKPGVFPFSKTVDLPFLNDARYLLHVRSLDGQATNKLFTVGEPYL